MLEFWHKNQLNFTSLSEIETIVQENPIERIKFNFDLRVNFYLENIDLPTDIKKTVIWLGTFHYNGYEREKYLDLLIQNFDYQDINRILHRLLDWVTPIREKADTWLLNHFKNIPVKYFIDNLLILQKITRSDKAKKLKSITLVNDYIWHNYQDNFPKNIRILQSYQRAYFYQIAKQRLQQPKAYIDSLLSDRDPQLRNQIFSDISDDYFTEIIPKLIKDKSTRIRYNAIKKMVIIDPYDYYELFIQFLTDKSQKNRNYTQFYLDKLWDIDVYNYYRINHTHHEYYAVFLADFAKPEDYNFFYNILLSSSSSIVKYYCLLAMIKMNKLEEIKPIFFDLLPLNNKIKKILEKLISTLFSVSEMLADQNKFLETGISAQKYFQILYKKSVYFGLNENLKYVNRQANFFQQTILLINQNIIKNATLYQQLPSGTLKQEIAENWKLFHQKFLPQLDPNLNKELTFIFKTNLLNEQ